MWSQTFVLADKIKMTLLPWMAALIVAATASDQLDPSTATVFPLSLLGVFAQAYVVAAALRIDRNPAAQEAIRPRVVQVLIIGIVTGLAIVIGGLLFIVPGVFLLVRWWVVVPIVVDRDIGVGEALRESWALTAPHWASILGVFLVVLAFMAVPFASLVFLGGLDQEVASLPMSLAMNLVLYVGTMTWTVSTVAVYRAIYQPVADLRQVFE